MPTSSNVLTSALHRSTLFSGTRSQNSHSIHSSPHLLQDSSSQVVMVYVVRDHILLDVPARQPGDAPVYKMQDCSVRIQNPNDIQRGGDPAHPTRSMIGPQTFTNTVYVSTPIFLSVILSSDAHEIDVYHLAPR